MTQARKLVAKEAARLYFRNIGREAINDIINTNYAPDSRFQDPFFDVTGRDKVLTQFIAMHDAFDAYELKSYTVDESSEDASRIDINSDAYYVIKGKTVRLDQQTQLFFNEADQITFHHDVFKGSFAETIDTTPGLRELFTGWRKLVGLVGDPILKNQFDTLAENKNKK